MAAKLAPFAAAFSNGVKPAIFFWYSARNLGFLMCGNIVFVNPTDPLIIFITSALLPLLIAWSNFGNDFSIVVMPFLPLLSADGLIRSKEGVQAAATGVPA